MMNRLTHEITDTPGIGIRKIAVLRTNPVGATNLLLWFCGKVTNYCRSEHARGRRVYDLCKQEHDNHHSCYDKSATQATSAFWGQGTCGARS